jgi:hypothetical protein
MRELERALERIEPIKALYEAVYIKALYEAVYIAALYLCMRELKRARGENISRLYTRLYMRLYMRLYILRLYGRSFSGG